MKSFAILTAVVAVGIMNVAAQNYPANMPQCGVSRFLSMQSDRDTYPQNATSTP